MKYLFICLLMTMMSSCKEKNKNIKDINSLFPKTAIQLKSQKCIYPDLLIGQPARMLCIGDYIVICDCSENKSFHLIDIEKELYLSHFGTIGQGPDEFLSPYDIQMYNDSMILVVDIRKQCLDKVNILNVINEGQGNRQEIFTNKELNFAAIPTKYGTFVTMGVYEDSQYRVYSAEGELIGSFFEFPYKDEEEKQISNRVRAMAYQGKISLKPTQDRFVFAVSFSPMIFFYKINEDSLELVTKTISAYPKYVPKEREHSLAAAKSPKNVRGYLSVAATNNYVYTLYSGKNYADHGNSAFNSTTILVFDWDGNPIKKMETDVPLVELCVTEDDHFIYAIANEEDYELVKFEI